MFFLARSSATAAWQVPANAFSAKQEDESAARLLAGPVGYLALLKGSTVKFLVGAYAAYAASAGLGRPGRG